jgi:hypothetical protein
MDDHHTMLFTFASRSPDPQRPPRAAMQENTSDWLGRFRLEAKDSNDYLIDREQQRRNQEYSGLPGFLVQDQAVTESMGGVYDRSQEHLGTSDAMIIRTRRRLLTAALNLRDENTTPPGVETPEHYRVRAGGVFLEHNADWVTETIELRKAFLQHPEADVSISGPITGF